MQITFQGAAAKLSYFFSCVVCQVLARFFFFYFLMSTFQNYNKTIIRLRLSKCWRSLRLGKYSPIFTSPSADNIKITNLALSSLLAICQLIFNANHYTTVPHMVSALDFRSEVKGRWFEAHSVPLRCFLRQETLPHIGSLHPDE